MNDDPDDEITIEDLRVILDNLDQGFSCLMQHMEALAGRFKRLVREDIHPEILQLSDEATKLCREMGDECRAMLAELQAGIETTIH